MSAYPEDRRQSVHNCSSLEKLKGNVRAARNTGRLAGEGQGTVLGPKDEVEADGPRHDTSYTQQD
jgi:hypothetical protein